MARRVQSVGIARISRVVEAAKLEVTTVAAKAILATLVAVTYIAGTGVPAAAASKPVPAAARVDDARLRAAEREPDQWLVDGGRYGGWHFSPLKQIDERNVGRLAPAWVFELDTNRGQEAEPLVVDGTMYLSTAWSKVYALDARTGAQRWKYDPRVPGEAGARACCDVVNRGVAVYRGRVYVATIDGRLVALDARDGRVVWSVRTTPEGSNYSITGAPRVAAGKVIIGNSGGEFATRGYVTAYDAATGALAWRFYLVPGDPARGPDGAASDEVLARLARPTWDGEWWKYGGGGNAWSSIAYDAALGLVYVGTGNGAPWNRRYRSNGTGDNLFLASIVALDVATGRYRWHYQVNPGESWDYSATMSMVLADLPIGGKLRKVLMQAPKNGFFYVIDRESGELLSANPFVDGITWASRIDLATGRPVEAPNVRYENGPFELSPGASGAHNWHPMAFDPTLKRVFFSAVESEQTIATEATFSRYPGPVDSIGVDNGFRPMRKRYLLGWDPIANAAAWRVEQPAGQQPGGVLATAGGLVFQGIGGVTGELVAYRASDGARVWSAHLPNAPIAAPIAYRIDGRQYVAVITGTRGAGSATGSKAYARQFGRMVAFTLDGKAVLPPDPAPAPPANPPGDTWPGATVALGEAKFARFCMRCHGPTAVSSNVIPDLRRSALLTDASAWRAVVVDGVLKDVGMVGWSNVLTPDDAEAIRAYVGGRAKQLAAGDAGAVGAAH